MRNMRNMYPHRSPPSSPFLLLCISTSLLLSLAHPAAAIPLRTAIARPHDHWAQLLRAGRYSLLQRPEWLTMGSQHSSTVSSPTLNLSTSHSFSLNPAARNKIYKGKGNKSRFECHVFDPPASINIDTVISRMITICESAWESKEKVLMRLQFRDLGPENALANGGGTYYVRMEDSFNTILPVAAAEAVRGRNINGKVDGNGKYDVLVTVNTKTPWYAGVDGRVPETRYDLLTVLLHEVYHNVLFAGAIQANFTRDTNYPGGVRHQASLHNNYRTRFDSFLANKDNCAVLPYLSEQPQTINGVRRSGSELLGDALCNDQLFWAHGNTRVAKLYSPRVFMQKSSIYHLSTEDPSDSLMFPTVRRGSHQHTVSAKILRMQRDSLNPEIPGARTNCRRPLADPTPGKPATDPDFSQPGGGVDCCQENNNFRTPTTIIPDDGVGGLPVWAFVLLIVLAALFLLLLLGLCLALLFRRRKNRKESTSHFGRSQSSSSRYPHTKPTTSSSDSSPSRSTYVPGHGGKVSSRTSRTSRTSQSRTSRTTTTAAPTSLKRTTTTRPSTSRHTTSKHTSKHTTSKHTTEPRQETERTKTTSKKHTCPSSGKSRYVCCCKCCRSSTVSAPPPIASVHTFDPDSVPSIHTSHKHKSSHKSSSHKHVHSCRKTVKKTCKSKSIKSCHCACYCCRYKPATCKTSTTCCKTSSRASSSRCPPSTKPPSTKPPSTKPSSSSQCKMCCSSKSSKTSSCSYCKPCTSSKSTSKAPTVKPPSTKPPSSKSCHSCRTCKAPSEKPQCHRCERIVEINIC